MSDFQHPERRGGEDTTLLEIQKKKQIGWEEEKERQDMKLEKERVE